MLAHPGRSLPTENHKPLMILIVTNNVLGYMNYLRRHVIRDYLECHSLLLKLILWVTNIRHHVD